MNVFIIIPAYNEDGMIGRVADDVKKFGQVVVVDDCSSDLTAQKAKEAGVVVLSHLVNRGQGATLQTGMDYALMNNADIVIHFDADGQHNPDDIEKALKIISAGEVDVILGTRFLDNNSNIPFVRRLVLKLAISFTRCVSGIKVTDAHNGFRVLSRKAIEKIRITQDRMAHASEILDEIVKYNLKYQEMPVQIRYTEYSIKKGQSSLGFVRILRDLILGKLFK